MSKVVVISGVPGAGKSTLAGLLATHCERRVHLEADQFQKKIVKGDRWPKTITLRGCVETTKQGLWIDTSTHSVEQSLQTILSRYEKEALLIRENS